MKGDPTELGPGSLALPLRARRCPRPRPRPGTPLLRHARRLPQGTPPARRPPLQPLLIRAVSPPILHHSSLLILVTSIEPLLTMQYSTVLIIIACSMSCFCVMIVQCFAMRGHRMTWIYPPIMKELGWAKTRLSLTHHAPAHTNQYDRGLGWRKSAALSSFSPWLPSALPTSGSWAAGSSSVPIPRPVPPFPWPCERCTKP